MLNAADQALYVAKNNGKDRAETYWPEKTNNSSDVLAHH